MTIAEKPSAEIDTDLARTAMVETLNGFAKRLVVALVGYRDHVRVHRGPNGQRTRSTQRQKFHDFELILDGEVVANQTSSQPTSEL